MIATILFTLLLQAPAQPPTDVARALQEGNAALAAKHNDEALAAFDRALALDAANPDVHVARGRALAALQRHDEAIAECTKALELRPSDAAALVNRGHYYINRHALDRALADLTRAEALAGPKSDDHELWYHLALARYITGDFKKAAATYDNCVRTSTTPDNKTSCKAWQYLALRRAGRGADAQKLLDGFAPDPKQEPSAYIDRLLLFKGVKTEDEVAKTMAKDQLQLPTVAYSLGMWHLLNGRDAKAKEYFEKASTPPAQQSAFGAVAASAELERLKKKT